jgi:hypothetical protein
VRYYFYYHDFDSGSRLYATAYLYYNYNNSCNINRTLTYPAALKYHANQDQRGYIHYPGANAVTNAHGTTIPNRGL